jgi:hypothetical protein
MEPHACALIGEPSAHSQFAGRSRRSIGHANRAPELWRRARWSPPIHLAAPCATAAIGLFVVLFSSLCHTSHFVRAWAACVLVQSNRPASDFEIAAAAGGDSIAAYRAAQLNAQHQQAAAAAAEQNKPKARRGDYEAL